MPPHSRDRRAFAPMLAVPAVPVVEDHVHPRGVLREVIDTKKLHHGGAVAAPALRIETANAEELRGFAAGSWLPHGASNHGGKAVEVLHAKLFRQRV